MMPKVPFASPIRAESKLLPSLLERHVSATSQERSTAGAFGGTVSIGPRIVRLAVEFTYPLVYASPQDFTQLVH